MSNVIQSLHREISNKFFPLCRKANSDYFLGQINTDISITKLMDERDGLLDELLDYLRVCHEVDQLGQQMLSWRQKVWPQ